MPMLIGGAVLLVVIVLLVMMNRPGGGENSDKDTPAKAAAPDAGKASTPAPTPVQLGSAKGGKAPVRPAPVLTAETLGKVTQLFNEMKAHYNDGSNARTAGDNAAAREHQAKAVDVLDQIDKLIEAPLLWQEEAEMEGWAQSAEYVQLATTYGKVMKLAKQVRMGGGK